MELTGLTKKGTRETTCKGLSGKAAKLASMCNYEGGSIVIVS